MKSARICDHCKKPGSFYGLMTFCGKRAYWHIACLRLLQNRARRLNTKIK